MGELDQEQLRHSLTVARLEKLNIEIQKLKTEKNWQDRFAQYTPLISVLIAVGGFLFGVYQYLRQDTMNRNKMIVEQEKARITEEVNQTIRIQNQIRANLDQLLQFTTDKGQTVSKALFLLEDLKSLLKIDVGGKHNPEDVQDRKRKITYSLVQLIGDDCDFNVLRDVDFAITAFKNWDDYKEYITSDRSRLMFLIGKHADALADVYYKAPFYVSSMRYDTTNNLYLEPEGYSVSDQSHFRHFNRLIISYTNHLELLEDKPDLRISAVKDFQAAICNETLTKQLFNISFDQKSDRAFFGHCFKHPRRR